MVWLSLLHISRCCRAADRPTVRGVNEMGPRTLSEPELQQSIIHFIVCPLFYLVLDCTG